MNTSTDTKLPTNDATLPPTTNTSDAIVHAPATAPTTHDDKSAAPVAATMQPASADPISSHPAPPDYYSSEKSRQTPAQATPQHNAPAAASQQQQPAQGQLVTPLWHLKRDPAWIDCPKCKTQTLTRINRESGSQATLWGVIICLVAGPCLAWIPCCMPSCKDTLHYCSRCDLPLAIAKANGSVEVAQPAVAMQPSQFAYQPPAHETKNAAPMQVQSSYAEGAQHQQGLPQQPTAMHTNAV